MIAQLKAAATRPQGGVDASAAPVALAPGAAAVDGAAPVAKVNFADTLKNSLDALGAGEAKAQALGKAFTAGDDKVSLSDVMIAMQKSSIEFQATVQVRNKLVSAYHEIMNMQV